MESTWELTLLQQQSLIVLCSGFNALHFLGYRSSKRGRRWGAKTLALVNLAFLVQSLYLGLLPSLIGREDMSLLLSNRLRFTVGGLPLAASLLISAFVIRWRKAKGRHRQ